MAQANGRETVSSEAYATAADFEQIFVKDMSVLYLLSLLLTGDPDKAEQCFVSGIGESTKRNRVFKEWARSWARRTIVQSAIRLTVLRQSLAGARREPADARALEKVPLVLRAEISAILELPAFERFVFVMSTLERYSDHDCSILLGCARRDVAPARARAVRHLAGVLAVQPKLQADTSTERSTAQENSAPVIELLIAQHFAMSTWELSA